jgi:hypothetical protein
MNSALIAKSAIRSLPSDPEEPERALRFFEFVRSSGSNRERRDVLRCVYRLAADGTWQIDSPADLNMLVYGLRENLTLVKDVSADVERILARFGIRGGELSAWNYIRRCAKAASAS